MALSILAPLLPALDAAFGEDCLWLGQRFIGRFISDPFTVPLAGSEQGLGVSQTWLYCIRERMPLPVVPEIGAVITIRGREWEVVEAGEDDLGELQYRLIRFEGAGSPDPPLEEEEEAAERSRPGRPSRRDEILIVYDEIMATGRIDRTRPLSHIFPLIRLRLTGKSEPTLGLGDKTLHLT